MLAVVLAASVSIADGLLATVTGAGEPMLKKSAWMNACEFLVLILVR